MKQYSPRIPRRLALLAGAATIVATGTLGWYATQSVHPPCLVFTGQYTPLNAPPRDETTAASKELVARAYRKAVDSGRCDPPHARWHEWLD